MKLWMLLVLAAVVAAEEAKEDKERPFKITRSLYKMLSKDLKLSLEYDGVSSKLALTAGLPMAITIYDTDKLEKPTGTNTTSSENRKKREIDAADDEPEAEPAKEQAKPSQQTAGSSAQTAGSSAVIASIPVLANATEVKGERVDEGKGLTVHTLNITFDEVKAPEGVNSSDTVATGGGKINKLQLTFKMVTSWNVSYWDLSELSIVAEGSTDQGTFSVNNNVVVAPRSGYTSKPADKACGRGYSTCAPVNLCWSCSVMDLKPNSSQSDAKFAAGIILPGMKLQPFYKGGNSTSGNSTTKSPKFGYEWDCDPVIPSALWAILLLTLAAAALLGWAVSYIADVRGPDRFDTAKTIPMLGNKGD